MTIAIRLNHRISVQGVVVELGSGALILFGMAQATMSVAGLRRGKALQPWGWVGLLIAAGGLGYLALPGLGKN
jgi:hypothetical protein